MHDDQLDAAIEWFRVAHETLDALPEGSVKTRGRRLLALHHAAGNALWDHLGDNGVVRPFDGTNKPPGP